MNDKCTLELQQHPTQTIWIGGELLHSHNRRTVIVWEIGYHYASTLQGGCSFAVVASGVVAFVNSMCLRQVWTEKHKAQQ